MEKEIVEIDGSYGSGGGSVVRLAIALSAITQIPIKVKNIRTKRKTPGIKTQHLRAIETVAKLCDGILKGAKLGSTTIEFYPKKIRAKKLEVEIETAGNVGLLLQCALPPCFFSDKGIEIEIIGGGTLGKFAPNIYYTQHILFPTIKKMGFNAEIEVKKHGFFPKGGSQVIARTKPVKEIRPLILKERGKLKAINGISIASSYLEKDRVAERTTNTAKQVLAGLARFSCPIKIKNEYVRSLCPGSGLILWAEFDNCILGWDSLGERGKPSFKVGKEATTGLVEQINTEATVDSYLADQLLIFLALARKGVIKTSEITKHVRTNIHIIEQFLPVKFEVDEKTAEIKVSKA